MKSKLLITVSIEYTCNKIRAFLMNVEFKKI